MLFIFLMIVMRKMIQNAYYSLISWGVKDMEFTGFLLKY